MYIIIEYAIDHNLRFAQGGWKSTKYSPNGSEKWWFTMVENKNSTRTNKSDIPNVYNMYIYICILYVMYTLELKDHWSNSSLEFLIINH